MGVERRVNTVAGGSTGTVRNLRIREDTAKYLLNLDLESAYYDPKSRSMRDDPTPEKPLDDKSYAGDNFIKKSGKDFLDFMELQMHYHHASETFPYTISGASPTQAEALIHKNKAWKEKLLREKKSLVYAKYSYS